MKLKIVGARHTVLGEAAILRQRQALNVKLLVKVVHVRLIPYIGKPSIFTASWREFPTGVSASILYPQG